MKGGRVGVLLNAAFVGLCCNRLNALGVPVPELFGSLPPGAGLLHVVTAVYGLLVTSLPRALPFHAAVELYATHPPDCRCDTFPVPFEEVQMMDEDDAARVIRGVQERWAANETTKDEYLRNVERCVSVCVCGGVCVCAWAIGC